MSPDERASWSRLLSLPANRNDAIEAILDRVEQLESELATDRASLLPLLAARDRALARVVELEEMLERQRREETPCKPT